MSNKEELIYHWDDEPSMGLTREDFDTFLLWGKNVIGANDLFIETNETLGIKKDGVTYNVSQRLIERSDIVKILGEIYQESSDSELRTGKELNFPYSLTHGFDEVIRFRVCVTACNSIHGPDEGIEIVMRPSDGIPPSVTDLNVSKELIDTTNYSEGIVLITGPTGSGKTTLLASLVRYIVQTQRKHVLSYEEPIEYFFKMIPNRLSRIIQSEVPLNLINFQKAISNSLRRAPDIILVGELREIESIDGGLLAAQTGHLVYATGHTNNVANALDRFVDPFPQEDRQSKLMKLASSVKAIIHQRLVPKRGGGRLAIQEELFITNNIRYELLNELSSKGGALTNKLNECVIKYGKTLKADVRANFVLGLLAVDVCFQEIAQDINSTDIVFFTEQTEKLSLANVISLDEKTKWLDFLGGYNARL
jgi:defect-in-organelle-trafficking protein DotB